jgi:hypothetical protein
LLTALLIGEDEYFSLIMFLWITIKLLDCNILKSAEHKNRTKQEKQKSFGKRKIQKKQLFLYLRDHLGNRLKQKYNIFSKSIA